MKLNGIVTEFHPDTGYGLLEMPDHRERYCQHIWNTAENRPGPIC